MEHFIQYCINIEIYRTTNLLCNKGFVLSIKLVLTTKIHIQFNRISELNKFKDLKQHYMILYDIT